MTYVLIVLWIGISDAGKTALSVEFNDMNSCQAAAALIRKKTESAYATNVPVLICAAKGKP